MGTRNLVCVVKDNKYKVAQYGQWDGYPEGQGLVILNFLRECDLDKFRIQIDKCTFIEDEDFFDKAYAELGIDTKDGYISMKNADKFASVYPQLSRDMGGKVLEFIYNNDNVLLQDSVDFAHDSLFCEWAYVVDLDKNTFEVYEGFNKEPLSKEERFYSSKQVNEYYPVKHVISFNLDSLPTKSEFLGAFASDEEDEDGAPLF